MFAETEKVEIKNRFLEINDSLKKENYSEVKQQLISLVVYLDNKQISWFTEKLGVEKIAKKINKIYVESILKKTTSKLKQLETQNYDDVDSFYSDLLEIKNNYSLFCNHKKICIQNTNFYFTKKEKAKYKNEENKLRKKIENLEEKYKKNFQYV